MLFLPLGEDSLLFRLCLYYGVLVLLLELLIPLLFQRRVRIEIPRVVFHAPAVPLSTREFQQRRMALQQQVAALQRSLAETPRQSSQKRRQLTSATVTKDGSAASPSSLLASPTSSVKVTRPHSSRKTSSRKMENEASRRSLAADSVHKSRSSPMTMGDLLATRAVRRGGFSFSEVFEDKESSKEKDEDVQKEQDDWTQAVNMRTMRRRESPTLSRRRSVRFVSEEADGAGYMGVSLEPSEATTRLEALIEACRRQRANTSQSYVPSPPPSVRIPSSATTALVAPVGKVLEHSAFKKPNQAARGVSSRQQDKDNVMDADEERKQSEQSGASSPLRQQDEHNTLREDGRRKGSEKSEPLTDFQAFCASFAAGGSAAAQRVVAKRKHHEAFEAVDKQVLGSATTLQQFLARSKRLRTLGQDMKQRNGDDTAETPHSGVKRTHSEAFSDDDKQAIDSAAVTRQVLEKRKHDQAFGTTDEQEQPDEKTPRIARRILFGDEVTALADTPSKEMPGRLSNGKRKCTQAFGMKDEDDEDSEWRDSLAFRPHRFEPTRS